MNNEQKTFSVEPINLVPINGFRISNIIMNINQNSATIAVELSNNNIPLITKYLTIDGDDYINWGANYPFLADWVCAKLGLVLI